MAPSFALLISRYILPLGQRGWCCFCAACPNRKMYLEIRSANEGALRSILKSEEEINASLTRIIDKFRRKRCQSVNSVSIGYEIEWRVFHVMVLKIKIQFDVYRVEKRILPVEDFMYRVNREFVNDLKSITLSVKK